MSINKKTIVFLIVFVTLNSGIHGIELSMRCKRPKSYAFCGSFTTIRTQWFFDSVHWKCLPYEFCVTTNEIEIPENSPENRFEDENQCELFCKENKYPKREGKVIESGKKIKDIKNFDFLNKMESPDPSRCMKPKAYSFCGSHSIPRIHWYYNGYHKRCFPYNYCETLEDNPSLYKENNFYTEKECANICRF